MLSHDISRLMQAHGHTSSWINMHLQIRVVLLTQTRMYFKLNVNEMFLVEYLEKHFVALFLTKNYIFFTQCN